MAFSVIRELIGEEWFRANIALSKNPNPFFLKEFAEESENRYLYQLRVGNLADALFRMRTFKNFDAFVKRFEHRDHRGLFYEAMAARSLADALTDVEVRVESGIKGQDFDFLGVDHDGIQFDIEVTQKQDGEPTIATLRNLLKRKRRQFSGDSPGILFVTIPENWADKSSQVEEAFAESTSEFFQSSQRVNLIVFQWERVLTVDEGRVQFEMFRSYENPNPRFAVKLPAQLTGENNESQTNPEAFLTTNQKELHNFAHVPSFFSWANWEFGGSKS